MEFAGIKGSQKFMQLLLLGIFSGCVTHDSGLLWKFEFLVSVDQNPNETLDLFDRLTGVFFCSIAECSIRNLGDS